MKKKQMMVCTNKQCEVRDECGHGKKHNKNIFCLSSSPISKCKSCIEIKKGDDKRCVKKKNVIAKNAIVKKKK